MESKQAFELNEDGTLKNIMLMTDEEIDNYTGLITTEGWDERLFEPRYDFVQEKWVEGLSQEEAQQRLREIEEQHNKPSELEQLKQENEMLAFAIMELGAMIMNGGK